MASIPREHVLLVVPEARIRTAHHPHRTFLVAQEATAEAIDRIPQHPTLAKVAEDDGAGLSRGDEEVTALLPVVVEVIAVAATPRDRQTMMTRNSMPRQGMVQLQTLKIMPATACVGHVQELITPCPFHPLPLVKIMK